MTTVQLANLDVVVTGAHPGHVLKTADPNAWADLEARHLSALLQGAHWSLVQTVAEEGPQDGRAQALIQAHHWIDQDTWPDAAWRTAQWQGIQAWVTPCHWHMAQGQTLMLDPHDLKLDDASSMALMSAMQPYFEGDGLQLHWHDALNWRLSGPALQAWPSHTLQQVIGRDVQIPLSTSVWPMPLSRLHIEMQMLLYTHPLNEARAQQGLPSVNSFWVHGVGQWPATQAPSSSEPVVWLKDELESAWRTGGPNAWRSAWRELDETLAPALLAQLEAGTSVRLHWCAPHSWRSASLLPHRAARRRWSWPWSDPKAHLRRHLQALSP